MKWASYCLLWRLGNDNRGCEGLARLACEFNIVKGLTEMRGCILSDGFANSPVTEKKVVALFIKCINIFTSVRY